MIGYCIKVRDKTNLRGLLRYNFDLNQKKSAFLILFDFDIGQRETLKKTPLLYY